MAEAAVADPISVQARRRRDALVAAGVCAALLLVFWVRAQAAIWTKSSTYDEPMHAAGAWVHRHHLDFRINYEDPPLWHYWAALPNGRGAIKADFASPGWTEMAQQWNNQWTWTVQQLYRTEGNDGERFVQRARSMMIVLGVALGAMLCWWAWQAGGVVAAIVAGVLFTLDPNFLAHAALVKNDVAISVCLLGLLLAVWRMGRVGITPWNLAGASIACAAAMTTKFTGVVLAPAFLVLLLTIRAVWPAPWRALRWRLETSWQRLIAAAGAAAVVGVVSYIGIWAAYGFRFSATPDPGVRLNLDETLRQSALFSAQAASGDFSAEASDRAVLSYIHWYALWNPSDTKTYEPALVEHAKKTGPPWEPPGSVRLALRLLDLKLAPEAWLNGLLFVQARSYIRGSYLDGEKSVTGFASYFPRAMAYKTPLATLAAMALAAAVGAAALRSRWKEPGRDRFSAAAAAATGVAAGGGAAPAGGSVPAADGVAAGGGAACAAGAVGATGTTVAYGPGAGGGEAAGGVEKPETSRFRPDGEVEKPYTSRFRSEVGGAWLLACLGLPAAIYLWMSVSSNLNIGLRHVLPVYPWLFMGAALAVAWAWRWRRNVAAVVAGALGVGLAVESFAIAPDYLTFFNVAAGGQRGGLHRLGDSNLDWGQDLPAVAAWQQRNPDVPLYFSYFGMVDPAFYKIRYLNMPGGYVLNPQAFVPPPDAVMAVSVTNLQCVYMPTPFIPDYERLRGMEPTEILGGTIYVYDLRRKK